MIKYFLALVAIILVLGCTTNAPQNSTFNSTSASQVVKTGDHISVDYTGMLENGTIFDSSAGRVPLEFNAGGGQMIKGFDAAVIGMRVGEEKTVTIKPEDAYGQYDEKNIVAIPITSVPNGTKVGDTLYAGRQSARVLDIKNNTAVLDVNHPLAGKTLIFKIKIVKIN